MLSQAPRHEILEALAGYKVYLKNSLLGVAENRHHNLKK